MTTKIEEVTSAAVFEAGTGELTTAGQDWLVVDFSRETAKNRYRIVAIADPHVGRDSWGVTPATWDAPLNEGVDYAIEHDADLLVILGDLFHRRSPTPAEYLRAMTILRRSPRLALLILDGNHDSGAAKQAVPATWAFEGQIGQWCERYTGVAGISYLAAREGFVQDDDEHGLDIVVLPWPRLVDYDLHLGDPRLSLDQLIAGARSTVLELLRLNADKTHPGHAKLLVGHSMLSYGDTLTPDDPGLLLGKDIVLPVSELPKGLLPLFGHVHQPDEYFVGSTQPTDFADTVVPKSFTVIDFKRAGEDGPWGYERKDIPYKTSLKTWDCVIVHEGETQTVKGRMLDAYRVECQRRGLTEGPRFDVARARVAVASGLNVDPAEVRRVLGGFADRVVSVDIVKPQQQVRRLGGDDAPIVATMAPDEALAKWLEVKGVGDIAPAVRKAFGELVAGTS